MWNFKPGDRVARGELLGVVTSHLKLDNYVLVQWDDGIEEGVHDETVIGSAAPPPPPKLNPI